MAATRDDNLIRELEELADQQEWHELYDTQVSMLRNAARRLRDLTTDHPAAIRSTPTQG